MPQTTLESTLRCPACGHTEVLTMPENACVAVHDCAHCGGTVRPKAGDCCVFCSYGSVPCPPIQAGIPQDQLTCQPVKNRSTR